MKIQVYTKEVDYNISQTLVVDGQEREHVRPLWECPEDAVIGRDLISCGTIASLMKEAHEAGARGEPLEIEKLDGEPE